MTSRPRFLTASAAARELGISAKALRLYEQRGLVQPGRTTSGWRVYGPAEMERGAEIVRLRKLELSLADIAELLRAGPDDRDTLLARYRLRLEAERRRLEATLRSIASAGVDQADLRYTFHPASSEAVAFDLPWPWGGERFALPPLSPITFITGPLGSGKTRLAMNLAEILPGARFLGLERSSDGDGVRSDAGNECRALCGEINRDLIEAGAVPSHALSVLIEAIYAGGGGPLVIDMVEQDLDQPTQEAFISVLRRRPPAAHPLFLMTRSSAILDLSKVESGETIIYCPANHSPPLLVRASPSCLGYEAVATCLASPDVRARTSGVIAARTAPTLTRINDSRETFC